MAGRLPPDATFQARGIMVSWRGYDALKEAVISGTAPTEVKCIAQLIRGFRIRSKKPSGLLKEMVHFIGATFGHDPMLRWPWFLWLPPYLPLLLSTIRKYSLKDCRNRWPHHVALLPRCLGTEYFSIPQIRILIFAGWIKDCSDDDGRIAAAAKSRQRSAVVSVQLALRQAQ